ncbi:MAG: hypothetical protein J5862_03110 [Bacteroidales bacterium]|nr:hypothetical protein [Bacteroidales bacterium]
MRETSELNYYRDYIGDKFRFPRSSKSYFETSCSEWKQSSLESKVLDLGYLVTHGFNLRKYVREYVADRPNNKMYVLSAFMKLIGYLRDPNDEYDLGLWSLRTNDKISIREAVDLFCKEVALRYEDYRMSSKNNTMLPYILVQQLKEMPLWDYEALAALKLPQKQYYEIFKLPTDEYLKKLKTLDL